jgi:hypothetical protein
VTFQWIEDVAACPCVVSGDVDVTSGSTVGAVRQGIVPVSVYCPSADTKV